MTTLREAAKEALEALKYHEQQDEEVRYDDCPTRQAITDLEAALSAPEPDPIANLFLGGIEGDEYGEIDIEIISIRKTEELQERLVSGMDDVLLPLYIAPPQPSIPEGWKLVPIEPTEDMVNAGDAVALFNESYESDTYLENTDDVYRAILAAAPEYKP